MASNTSFSSSGSTTATATPISQSQSLSQTQLQSVLSVSGGEINGTDAELQKLRMYNAVLKKAVLQVCFSLFFQIQIVVYIPLGTTENKRFR